MPVNADNVKLVITFQLRNQSGQRLTAGTQAVFCSVVSFLYIGQCSVDNLYTAVQCAVCRGALCSMQCTDMAF